jgi:preprotein translocase subunit YajC
VIAFLLESLLLAQAQAPPAGQGEDPFFLPRLLITFLPIAVLFYFFFIRPQKKKEQEYRDLISNVKENDRVLTIGGIYGVVTNVQRDAERVTVRVDETTGTKLRLNMSAIARVLTSEDQDGGTSGNKVKT